MTTAPDPRVVPCTPSVASERAKFWREYSRQVGISATEAAARWATSEEYQALAVASDAPDGKHDDAGGDF
jgi:hypothetical protein